MRQIVVPAYGSTTLEYAAWNCANMNKGTHTCSCELCIGTSVSILVRWLARLVGLDGATHYYCTEPPEGCEYVNARGEIVS